MDPITHTVVALIAFLLFYLWGLTRGHSIGLDEGLAVGSSIACKQTLEFCRDKFDLPITDYEIKEASEYLKDE
jgi:hypothetical protein